MTRRRIGCLFLVVLISLLLAVPTLMRAYYRISYLPLILGVSQREEVSPHLVAAVIFTESRFRRDARSDAGALGLMQLMPETAQEVAEHLGLQGYTSNDLLDPKTNITLGVSYLKYLMSRFRTSELVLAAYNAGPTTVEHWLAENEPVSYPETKQYIKSVLHHQACLEKLYPEWTR